MSFFMIHPTQSSTLFPYTTLFRSIPNAGIVVQVQPAGRHRTFNLSADEMNRNKLAAKLHHFRTADSRLEPLAMMVGGIPPIDGCVIAAEGYFERIALIETDDGTLHFGIEARGAPQSGVAAGAQRYFAVEVFFRGNRRHQMQRELPLAESTVCSLLVRSRKVDIRKTSQFQ